MNKLKAIIDALSPRRLFQNSTGARVLPKKDFMSDFYRLLLTHDCNRCNDRDRASMIRTILNKNFEILKIVHEFSVRPHYDHNHRCVFENALLYCYDWQQAKWRDEFVIHLLRTNNLHIIYMLPSRNNNSDIDLIVTMDQHRLKECIEYRLSLYELVTKRYINIK
ncbi:hypothetical protein KM620_gp120 [Hyposidra talaca nucleopolyhedrovirus]|uniref:Uncharacterized protein n=1 Tax=Hyposidra talaca nucleopolyhedrovirus TaxID=1070315 RepID=A0A2Z4HI60_9ABAC|nr:hypothetical protein KM620_gp120 [Hyposidra talaca nucleopolyhedrovirus]AWW14480.1 hypothetical protein HytaNPV_gp120 [Hyposidra talaca nucleopolyhedrovirus]